MKLKTRDYETARQVFLKLINLLVSEMFVRTSSTVMFYPGPLIELKFSLTPLERLANALMLQLLMTSGNRRNWSRMTLVSPSENVFL